jgi:restriction system protein
MAEESYENLMKPAHERFAVLHLPETRDVGPVPETNRLLWEAPVGSVAASHDAETRQLRSDILARIYVNTPEFFEHLIIDVLLRMGYANRRRDLARRLGRSHDGGIDGIIAQDELGLDLIYLQAKRLRPGTTVPISQVRDFAGSMEARHATKGLLVTTAQFTPQAHSFVSAVTRRVALINGEQLADIMIRHNIGVKVRETYQFKDLEPGYFRRVADAAAGKVNPSTGMSPSY